MISDDTIWRTVRDVAAEWGWHDRADVLRRAHLRLLDSGEPGVLWSRLERLWDERAEVKGAC